MSSLSFAVTPYNSGFGSGLPGMFPGGWGPGVNSGYAPQWGQGGGNGFANIPGFSGFPGGGMFPGGFPGGGFPGFPGGGIPGFPGGGFPGFPGGGFPGFPGGGFPGFPGGGFPPFPPFPPFPQPNGFNISTETVRASMYGFDANQDGAIDSNEATAAAARLNNSYNPTAKNLAKFYTQLGTALANGNRNVDRDGDGKLSFDQAPVFEPLFDDNPLAGLSVSGLRPGRPRDELTRLAGNDFDPTRVSNSDFRRPPIFLDDSLIGPTPEPAPPQDIEVAVPPPPPPPDMLKTLLELLKPANQDSDKDLANIVADLTKLLGESK